MTINTLDEFIKSVTVGDSAETKVTAIVDDTLAGSVALSYFRRVELDAKKTFIPFLRLPAPSDTSFKVGSIEVVAESKNSTAKLVDETQEDTTINMEAALNSVMTSQSRLTIEKHVADFLVNPTNVPVASGATAKNFSTVLKSIEGFPEQAFATDGNFVVFLSPKNFLTMVATMSVSDIELWKSGFIKMTTLVGLPANKMVVAHTHGLVLGLDFMGVEKDRHAGAQYTDLIPQYKIGVGVDTEYVRNITLN